MKDKKNQIARHLRQEQTPAETALWELLRNRNFENLKFRRQYPLKEYIVDFFCDELELVIELDGGHHIEKEQAFKDEQRDFHLSFLGYRILRYPNNEVFDNIDKIYSDIKIVKAQTTEHFKRAKIKKPNSQGSIKPAPFSAGEGLGMRVLSTKKLKPNQRDLLLGSGFSLVDYDAIEIEFLDFKMPSEIKNAIFTSQNSVRALINNSGFAPSQWERAGMRVFCVGQKTKALLEENELKVINMAQNSAELGDFIIKKFKNETFHYFCGSERRDELPELLKASKIELFEVKTYKTTLKPKKFDQKWDGILFFSPSGVASFAAENNMNNSTAFCIGKTTAIEAQKYTSNIVIANSTSVESVIAKAVKTLKKHNISE